MRKGTDKPKGTYTTASYTRKAQADYLKRVDKLQVTVEAGMKGRLSAVGLDNDGIRKLLYDELKKREQEQGASSPSADDLPEWFR